MLCRLAWLGAAVAYISATALAEDPTDLEFFEARIRPILAENCFSCHGPEKQKAGLRLDSAAGIVKGGESGPVILPGDPAQSKLARAISYEDPDLQMPPRSKLPQEKIDDITRWIKNGASWPDHEDPASKVEISISEFNLQKRKQEHWAWRPIRDPVVPSVVNTNWPLNDIDRFILARLESEQLCPAPAASRETLIRRASYDLTGLPPAPAEVSAFLEDAAPDAWPKVVDRLLASPAFGERWGRHWLDLMRYAESYGHEQDFPIARAWCYRDYVVRAFNADIPYDQFLKEHLAGDLLETPRLNPWLGFNESVIGTGFWFMGQATHAPVDSLQDEADRLDNQVDVFSKTFLGLTVACARCHDHKFDAISTKDYYSLVGFLKSSRRQYVDLDLDGEIAQKSAALRTLRLQADIARNTEADSISKDRLSGMAEYLMAAREVASGRAPSLMSVAVAQDLNPKLLEDWIRELSSDELNDAEHPFHAWRTLAWRRVPSDAAGFASVFDAWRTQMEQASAASTLFEDFNGPDHSGWSVSGEAFGRSPTTGSEWSAITQRRAAAGMAHSGLDARRLHGVLRSRTFIIQKPEIQYRLLAEKAIIRLVVDGYTMRDQHSLLFQDMRMEPNTDGRFQWLRQTADVGRYIGHRAHIEIEDAGDGFVAVDKICFTEAGAVPEPANLISRDLLTQFNQAAPASELDLAKAYESLATNTIGHWRASSEPGKLLVDWMIEKRILEGVASTAIPGEAYAGMSRLDREIPEPYQALAMTDGTPEDCPVYIRGSAKSLGEIVPRRMLEALEGPADAEPLHGSGRLQLAEAMLGESNPLTARVMVNRIWQHLFGRGLVATPDNFGALGEQPTHPELLDYLATRFRKDGWSVKRLIRSMMLSRTYQMQSEPTNKLAEEKDPANLLLHRMRMRRLEGEAIRDAMLSCTGSLVPKQGGPPVNIFMTPFLDGRNPPESGPLDGAGRRSIYLAARRNYLSPFLLVFDLPLPDSSVGRRNVSNVPAQALALMNDPFVYEQADRWAGRLLEISDPRARIEKIYLNAFARKPTESELYRALVFVGSQTRQWEQTISRPEAGIKAWTDLIQSVFMMKEFIFVS